MTRITEIDDLIFPVELRPIYADIKINGISKQIEISNKIVVNQKSGKPFGVVSSNYKLITNKEAIKLGEKCCIELFGKNETSNIKIFKVDAPSTASYCHIDMVHNNYIMNLWDENGQSDIYIPYIRITNSYNTSRALSFNIGFCREICSNGIIFESKTIKFTFSHVKHKLNKDISFVLQKGEIKKLFDEFSSYAKKLKELKVSKHDSLNIILALFRVKDKSIIDFDKNNEDGHEYDDLINKFNKKIDHYFTEIGDNAYSLFNVITDVASHPIQNRYFRRDMNSMQRLAGNWINSFRKEIEKSNFDIAKHIKNINNPSNEVLYSDGNSSVRHYRQ